MFFNHGGCLLFNLFKALPQLIQIFLYDLNQLARPCLNHTFLLSHILYHHGTLRTLLRKNLLNLFHSRKHLIHRPILNGNIFIYHFHTHTVCPHAQLNIHRSNTFEHFLCCFAQILLILLDCFYRFLIALKFFVGNHVVDFDMPLPEVRLNLCFSSMRQDGCGRPRPDSAARTAAADESPCYLCSQVPR